MLHVIGMLQCLISYLSQELVINGMSILFNRFKIGSQSQSLPLWILFILECGEEMEWTSFAQNLPLGRFFMSIPIIRLYTPVLICPFHGRLWKLNVQTKVSFSLWIEVWGKILTIDNLQRQLNVVLDWCWGI